ncbi:hypothetical protein [Brevundimonas sp.]|uniref:hypothetical protein n=1 Tax=Brevundimonas sp. TaxID=1871086 RepID=UPI003D0E2678
MRSLLLPIVAFALAGCATPAEVILGPTWTGPRVNTGERAWYPPAALAADVSGVVMVGCTITPAHRTEDCRILRETPTGYGFGAAAVGMHQHVAVPPTAPPGPAFFTVPFCTSPAACEAQSAISQGWRREMRAGEGGGD